MTTEMNIEVGKIYQSRNFPNITRKVVHIKDGIVTYSIINSQKSDVSFYSLFKIVENEFKNCSLGEAK